MLQAVGQTTDTGDINNSFAFDINRLSEYIFFSDDMMLNISNIEKTISIF